jgi:Domain of unknown function (DUF4413)
VYHDFENIDLRRIAEDVHGDSPLSPIIEAMREKFLKYWDEISLIIIIANCLHPSFKKKYTIRLLERYKKNLNLPHIREEQRVTSKCSTYTTPNFMQIKQINHLLQILVILGTKI